MQGEAQEALPLVSTCSSRLRRASISPVRCWRQASPMRRPMRMPMRWPMQAAPPHLQQPQVRQHQPRVVPEEGDGRQVGQQLRAAAQEAHADDLLPRAVIVRVQRLLDQVCGNARGCPRRQIGVDIRVELRVLGAAPLAGRRWCGGRAAGRAKEEAAKEMGSSRRGHARFPVTPSQWCAARSGSERCMGMKPN